jgi:hypothetical protein
VYLKNNLLYARGVVNKPCKVESYCLGVVFVRPYRGRELLEVSPDDLDYCCDEVLTSQEKRKLIQDYIKIEGLKTYKDWNSEIGIINRLEKMYPLIDFWRNFHIEFRLKSFAWYLGGGKEQVAMMFKKFAIDNQLAKVQTCSKLADTKLGEDVSVKKQLNLFE